MKEIPPWGFFTIIGFQSLVSFLFPAEFLGLALTAGWFVIGGMCLWNYASCGRYHCAITGPGILAIGAASLLPVLGIMSIAIWMMWTAFVAIMAVGFGLEYLYKTKAGTSYRYTHS